MHSERRVVERRSDGSARRATQRARARARWQSKVHGLKVVAGALEQLPPLTVRFWDGSTVAARDDPDAPVVLIRDEQAIAHFLHSPNQLGLSRAWVSGALDVDGDLEKVLDLRHQVRDLSLGPMGRVRLMGAALRVAGRACAAAAADPALRGPARGTAALAAPRQGGGDAITTTSRTASTRCCSARAWSTPARTSSTPTTRSRRAQERKLELICRKLRLQPGERLLDIGCGWGSLVLHAARAPRRAGARRDALGAAGGSTRAQRIEAAGPLGSRRDPRARLPRARRAAVRQDLERRHVRARRPGAARHLRRGRAPAAAPGRAVPQPRHHAHPHQAAARPDVHQPLRLPGRRAASGDRHHRRAGGRRVRDRATSSRCASTTRSRCAAGSRTSPPGARRRSPRSATSASASGGSTCSARRRASRAARSASTRRSRRATAPSTACRSTARICCSERTRPEAVRGPGRAPHRSPGRRFAASAARRRS